MLALIRSSPVCIPLEKYIYEKEHILIMCMHARSSNECWNAGQVITNLAYREKPVVSHRGFGSSSRVQPGSPLCLRPRAPHECIHNESFMRFNGINCHDISDFLLT
ncbi:hypothetical protein GUJ93_ZPchr0023g33399 [Zizania palustris]|uniref:Uncharacterized protein n=1 Tax=Zizania palustris TaxID=103762 RepID=A0A8J5V7U1_ZIZPA|nr:hypothetical protein GUJ93_ZPchr0023g33399 [Zizania palustris]